MKGKEAYDRSRTKSQTRQFDPQTTLRRFNADDSTVTCRQVDCLVDYWAVELVAMVEPNKQESNDSVEVATRWGLVALAALAVLGALLRVFLPERLDQTTLLYLGAAGGLLLLRQVKTFSLGQLKLEMIVRLQEQQQKQAEKIADITLILPLLLQDKEVKHIRNLFVGRTEKYQGSGALREELRRLRSIGLISKKADRNIGDMRDGMVFDLVDYVALTELGRRWASRIQEIQGSEASPEVKQPEKSNA
jgi:hypothetical protein